MKLSERVEAAVGADRELDIAIGEAIGQVMHRCEVMANPCKPTLAGDK